MKTKAFILGFSPNESKISLTTDEIFNLPVINGFILSIEVSIPPIMIAGEDFHNAYWIKAFTLFFENNDCKNIKASKIFNSDPDAIGGTIASCSICETDVKILNFKLNKLLILLREFKRQTAIEYITISIVGKKLQLDIQIE